MAQLIAKRATLWEEASTGRFTQLGGAQKNSTIEFGMSTDEQLAEVQFEIDFKNRVIPSSNVVENMSGYK